jgi:hypothetical protein
MTDRRDPEGKPPGDDIKQEISDTLAEAVADQAEKAKARSEATAPRDRASSPLAWTAVVVLFGVSLYLWFGSPSWLEPAPPEPLPPTFQEAGLRMEIFHQALNVEDFLEGEGRLPSTLVEAGDSSDVQYERLDDRRYRLWLDGSAGIVEYISTDSLELFLGDAEGMIREGGWVR